MTASKPPSGVWFCQWRQTPGRAASQWRTLLGAAAIWIGLRVAGSIDSDPGRFPRPLTEAEDARVCLIPLERVKRAAPMGSCSAWLLVGEIERKTGGSETPPSRLFGSGRRVCAANLLGEGEGAAGIRCPASRRKTGGIWRLERSGRAWVRTTSSFRPSASGGRAQRVAETRGGRLWRTRRTWKTPHRWQLATRGLRIRQHRDARPYVRSGRGACSRWRAFEALQRARPRTVAWTFQPSQSRSGLASAMLSPSAASRRSRRWWSRNERGRADGEAVEPEGDLGEFDGERVLVDAVDAALEDEAADDGLVGQLGLVDRSSWIRGRARRMSARMAATRPSRGDW